MWSALLLMLFVSPLSIAGERECISCCQAGGLASCRPSLRMIGPGSVISPEAGAWRTLGLWTIPCEGDGRFDPGATAVSSENPLEGEVLTSGIPLVAIHCFRQACKLPEGSCLYLKTEGRTRILNCESGDSLSAAALKIPGQKRMESGSVTAIVGDRPLVVQLTEGRPPRSLALPSVASPTPLDKPSQPLLLDGIPYYPAEDAAPKNPPESRVDSALLTSSSAAPPEPTHSPSPTAPVGVIAIELPAPAAEDRCTDSPTLRSESHRRVDIGNEALAAGRPQKAVDEYRAALTIDRCDAYAWAAIGGLALEQGRSDLAITAFQQTLRFNPRHYLAAARLGLAWERQGRLDLAVESFRRSLEIRPGFPEAAQGLERVGRLHGTIRQQ